MWVRWFRWMSTACLCVPCTAFTMQVDKQFQVINPFPITFNYTLANPPKKIAPGVIQPRTTDKPSKTYIKNINLSVPFVLRIQSELTLFTSFIKPPKSHIFDNNPHCYPSKSACTFNSKLSILTLH